MHSACHNIWTVERGPSLPKQFKGGHQRQAQNATSEQQCMRRHKDHPDRKHSSGNMLNRKFAGSFRKHLCKAFAKLHNTNHVTRIIQGAQVCAQHS